jgi:4-hydroxymandelate synthase
MCRTAGRGTRKADIDDVMRIPRRVARRTLPIAAESALAAARPTDKRTRLGPGLSATRKMRRSNRAARVAEEAQTDRMLRHEPSRRRGTCSFLQGSSRMVAREIDYVELYVSDQRAALDYHISSLGFTQVAESTDDARSSALLRQGGVTLIVTAGPATSEFLDVHGDGIADIALNCEDPAAAADAAAAAGASVHRPAPGHPVVAGFGGVAHTLLPMPASRNFRVPPDRPWTATSTTPIRPGRVRLLDHVAICVKGGTLAQHADFYTAAFGMPRYSSEYVAVGSQALDSIVVRSSTGGLTFTLVAPDPVKEPGQLDAFLARNGGPGVQHLAFGVDDIVPTVRELRDRGVEFLRAPVGYYDRLAERLPALGDELADLKDTSVLADRDEWGYLLQLFTRSPYERNTLFYEIIQRQGARGFGSANIRALYEAVERDLLSAGQPPALPAPVE